MNQSRGFVGRRSGANVTLPPGQYLTTDFPVLSASPTPQVPLDQWELTIDDGTNVLRRWSWKSFRELPSVAIGSAVIKSDRSTRTMQVASQHAANRSGT